MGSSYKYLRGSDGTGNAVLAHITSPRSIGSTVIVVDSLSKWSPFYIVTTGLLDANGYMTPASMTEMYAHTTAGQIIIDGFVPGYTDNGNTASQVAIIKPTNHFANSLVDNALVTMNDDGTPKDSIANPTGSIVPYLGRVAPSSGWLLCDGSAVSRATYAALFAAISPSIGAVTITIAAPGVVTLTNHGFQTGDQVYLTTTGALPTGLAANTLYYAVRIDANNFNLATTRANAYAGTKITTTGSQSGVQTVFDCAWGLGDGSTTFNIPDARGRVVAGNDFMGGTAANRLSLQRTEGVYGNRGAVGGEQGHQISLAESASHTHALSDPGFAPGVSNTSASAGSGGTGTYGRYGGGINTDSKGSDASHNNVQPTLVTNYLIKT